MYLPRLKRYSPRTSSPFVESIDRRRNTRKKHTQIHTRTQRKEKNKKVSYRHESTAPLLGIPLFVIFSLIYLEEKKNASIVCKSILEGETFDLSTCSTVSKRVSFVERLSSRFVHKRDGEEASMRRRSGLLRVSR